MSSILEILKALCGEDETLFNEVTHELIEAITFEEVKGIKQVDTAATLRLALELECVPFEKLPSRTTTLNLLKENAMSPALIEELLGKKGKNFKVTA